MVWYKNFIFTQLKSHTAVLILILMAGCSSGGGGTSGKSGKEISGIAATGAPVTFALLEIRGVENGRLSTETNEAGEYKADVAGLTSPLLLRVTTRDNRFLYSLTTTAGVTNLHPFTDLVIRNWFAVRGRDVTTEFDSNDGIANPPTPEEINSIQSAVTSIFAMLLQDKGLTEENFNFFADNFVADGTGFDGLLDQLRFVQQNGRFTVSMLEKESGVQASLIDRLPIDTDLTLTDDLIPVLDSAPIKVLPASDNEMIIAWNAAQDDTGIKGYRVTRTVDAVSTTFLTPWALFRDSGLTAASFYCYTLQAIDGAGNESEISPEVCKTAANAVTDPLTPPAGLVAEATGDISARLMWSASTEAHVLGYHIYRKFSGEQTEVRIATVTGTEFNDIGLIPDRNYCYKIKAFDITAADAEIVTKNLSDFGNEDCTATFISPDTIAPVVVAAPPGQDYTTPQAVVLSCVDDSGAIRSGGDTIFYTLDGTAPVRSSAQYQSVITAGHGTIIKSFCEDRAGNVSEERTDTYIIDDTPPTSFVVNTPGGVFPDTQQIELGCDDGEGVSCEIYYTTDLSVPAKGPTSTAVLYSGPVSVSKTTTLKFVAVDHLDQIEAVVNVQEYIIDRVAPQNDTLADFINDGALATSELLHTISIAASDLVSATENIGFVSDFCALEKTSATFVPADDAGCWQSIGSPLKIYNGRVSYQSVYYPYSIDEVITITVWFRDSVGHISPGVSDSIIFSGNTDSAPVNTTDANFIDGGAIDTTSGSVTVAIKASDDNAVTGYCIRDFNVVPATPLTTGNCWTDIPTVADPRNFISNISHVLTDSYNQADVISVMVWFRDAIGNISQATTDTITFGDAISPENTTTNNFINSGDAETGAVTVSVAISATDNHEVTRYCLMDNNTGVTPVPTDSCWTGNGPTANFTTTVDYMFTGVYDSGETVSVYVWFSDAESNISEVVSDSIIFRDIAAPTNTTSDNFINNGETNTISTSLTLKISALDNFDISDYCILSNTSGLTPTPDAGCWTAITPASEFTSDISYNITSIDIGNAVHVYVWFRDVSGNISDVKTNSISYADEEAPTNESLAGFIDDGAGFTEALSVMTALSATDNIAVTDYCVRDFNTIPTGQTPDTGCWNSITPTSIYGASVVHTLTDSYANDDIIYVLVWFRDAAGNISNPATDNIQFRITEAPANTTGNNFINSGASATNVPAVTLSLSATDVDGDVDSYFLQATDVTGPLATPAANDPGWSIISTTGNYSDEIRYLIPGAYPSGDQLFVHVWFRDVSGNISAAVTDSITVNSEVYFADNFENGSGNWDAGGSDWAISANQSVSQTRAATDSPGVVDYLPDSDASLTFSSSLDLSSSSSPMLDYWTRFTVSCPGDEMFVEVSVNGGNSWTNLLTTTDNGGHSGCGIATTWFNSRLDMSPFAGESAVLLRFRLNANGDATVGAGWTIDDVVIRETAVNAAGFPFSDDMEGNTNNWLLSGSDWNIDTTVASIAPGNASFRDNSSIGYRAFANTALSLVTPIDLTGSNTPMLSYWALYDVGDCDNNGNGGGDKDTWFVEVSNDNGLNWLPTDSNNQSAYCGANSLWQFFTVDLSEHSNSEILMRYRLRSDGAGTGYLHIDDIELYEGAGSTNNIPWSDDFESGSGDWRLSGQDWALDNTDSFGGGSSSFTADLRDNSFADTAPSLTLRTPVDLRNSNNPVLNYVFKFDLRDCSASGDIAYVEVSTDGGVSWEGINAGGYCDGSTAINSWQSDQISLDAFKARRVLIRFRLAVNGNGGGTWSIDEVEIMEQ